MEDAAASCLTVVKAEGQGGLPKAVLEHASGSKAEVYFHGATLTSFVPASGDEVIFMSEEAVFDGQTPIRGGIPLVFPQFGSAGLDMPSHGFARRSTWTLLDQPGRCVFQLYSNEETRAVWPHSFELLFFVELSENSLTTRLCVKNVGDAPFDFQALQHTYYKVDAIESVSIKGLTGKEFVDKMDENKTHTEGRDTITFAKETDRIYLQGSQSVALDGTRGDSSASLSIGLQAVLIQEDVVSKVVPHDTVVWNPWVAKAQAMGDFGDEEYHTMVCVEPGHVSQWCSLPPASSWTLTQTVECTP